MWYDYYPYLEVSKYFPDLYERFVRKYLTIFRVFLKVSHGNFPYPMDHNVLMYFVLCMCTLSAGRGIPDIFPPSLRTSQCGTLGKELLRNAQ